MKRSFIILLSSVLAFMGVFGTTGNVFAKSSNDVADIELTLEQERMVEETVTVGIGRNGSF